MSCVEFAIEQVLAEADLVLDPLIYHFSRILELLMRSCKYVSLEILDHLVFRFSPQFLFPESVSFGKILRVCHVLLCVIVLLALSLSTFDLRLWTISETRAIVVTTAVLIF